MDFWSRTSKGRPSECPVCGRSIVIDPSFSTEVATCPHCGVLFRRQSEKVAASLPATVTGERFPFVNSPGNTQISRLRADELIPKSVARENMVFPLGVTGKHLSVAVSDPEDLGMLEKLGFILNCQVQAIRAELPWIARQIQSHYGPEEWPQA